MEEVTGPYYDRVGEKTTHGGVTADDGAAKLVMEEIERDEEGATVSVGAQ